ncbi:hypothetical protein V5O48_015636 [Marasmius crinis-equi]|uniref:Glycosyl hydrolase family 92 N-terminal domain-containing protein n=1 Tax=Marasmius crinis-equi TaxID=585013 RepID=A0ABR3ETZ4_9AGAR
MSWKIRFTLVGIWVLNSRAAVFIEDPASLVLSFIGTTNGEHVFPGATLPHGMVKDGMDTDSPGNHAGYDADPQFNVTGFSQLHDDGTGSTTPLSSFKLFTFLNCTSFEKCPTSLNSRKVKCNILSDGTQTSPPQATSPPTSPTVSVSNPPQPTEPLSTDTPPPHPPPSLVWSLTSPTMANKAVGIKSFTSTPR